MKKRTCGTCGFFEAGELGGTGWCNHPQRRISIDLRIMVRKGELACRDGWSRDLWAPRSDVAVDSAAADETAEGALPPLSSEEMSVLIDSGQVDFDTSSRPPAAAPVDVVVGETPALPQMSDERATLLAHDPRAAIEAAQRRHLAKSSSSERPLESKSDTTDAAHEESDGVEDDARRGPHRRGARNAEPDQFSTVPEVREGLPLPRPARPQAPPLVAGAAEELPEDPRRISLQRLRERQSRSSAAPAAPRSGPPAPPLRVSSLERSPERPPGGRSWRDVLNRERQSMDRAVETAQPDWDKDVVDDEGEYLSTEAADAYDPLDEPEYIEAEEALHIADFDDAAEYEFDDDLDIGDTAVHVAPDVPRMCKTCRDFRPADNGERGWCNNSWAFSHRRMVDADELPCESSLGCWWLPHDDLWLATADAAAHSEPTPLVDQWLSRREAEVRRRQGS